MATSTLWRSSLRYDPEKWRPGGATLRAIGIAIPVGVAILLRQPGLGVLASLGALYSGIASFAGIMPVRIRRMLATTAVTALLAAVASLATHSTVAIVGTVTLGAFVCAVLGATSSTANMLAIQAMGVLIVFSALPRAAANPLGNALLVLAGGLVQTFLVVSTSPVVARQVEREAVASAFGSLASFVEGAPSNAVPDAGPFQEARARLDEALEYDDTAEYGALWHALRVAETIRAALVGLIASDEITPATKNDLVRALREVAASIRGGRFGLRPDYAAEPGHKWSRIVDRAFDELSRAPTEAEIPRPGARLARAWFGEVFNTESLRSMTFGHAGRYAFAVGVATLAYQVAGVEHGYWLPLTIAIVLRSDYATTLTRGLGRLVGTIVGVLLATVLVATIHPSAEGMTVGMLFAAWLAFAFYPAGYAAYAVAITLYVVFSLAGAGESEPALGVTRLGATLLGSLVALAMSLLWPIWQSENVCQVLSDAFRAQAAYGEQVRDLLQGGDYEPAEQARHHGRNLRVEAERMVEAVHLEPRYARSEDVLHARRLLEQLDENAAVLLSLHAEALEIRSQRLPTNSVIVEELEQAIQAAKVQCGAYVA